MLSLVFAFALLPSLIMIMTPKSAQAYPVGTCNQSRDGASETSNGITWKCRYVSGVGWQWVPVVYGSNALLFRDSNLGHSFNRSGANVGSGGGSYSSPLSVFGGYSGSSTQSLPPGYLADRIVIYKWDGASWYVCRDSGFRYNSVTTWSLKLSWNFGSTPPCGAGYYGSYGDQFFFKGGWRGGSLWSSSFWVGAAATKTMASSTEANVMNAPELPSQARPVASTVLPPRPNSQAARAAMISKLPPGLVVSHGAW